MRIQLRSIVLEIFRRFNPGDISIRHHYTGDRIRLHSFMHKGYWYYGKRRERETMALFSRLICPGDSVIEIGGHIGYISLFLSQLVGLNGQVTVFEPGPNNLPYARANVASKENVRLVEKAVSDFTGEASFYVENLTGQNNSLLPNYERFTGNLDASGLTVGIKKTVVTVECVRLDDYCEQMKEPLPSLIKIDVEGAELGALLGMQRVLKSGNAIVMVEVTDKAAAVYDLLTAAGFKGFTESRRPICDSVELCENSFWVKKTDARFAIFAPASTSNG